MAGWRPARSSLERDELVAEIDEGHAAAASAQLQIVHQLPEELEHRVEVPDLDGDVVDADEPGHPARLATSRDLTRT